jgi:hypothetical protein
MSDALTYDDVRGLKVDGDLGRFIKQHMAAGRVECARRRGLVLRYPDLAAKLTEPPLRFTTPEHWNGYIPPSTWNQAINTAPCRTALLALVEEAEKRQSQPRHLEEAA